MNHTSQSNQATPLIDIDLLKASANGRWAEILQTLAGIPRDILDGRHHPYPRCGGTDRFRVFDDFAETGGMICNRCFATKNGDGIAAIQWLTGEGSQDTVTKLADHLGIERTKNLKSNGNPRIVETYNYRNETSELLFQVVRYDPKDFRQRRPKAGGGWNWSVKGVRVVPYRLVELLAEPTRLVFVVEGEKDADNLARIGLLATCNAGGAGKWNTRSSCAAGLLLYWETMTTRAECTLIKSL
jgi:hypothetical protein